MDTKQDSVIHQILIKLLNGKHKILNFTTPIVPIENLKQRIQTLTLIPSHLQLLALSDSRILHDSHYLNLSSGYSFNGQMDIRNSCYVQSPEKGNGNSFPMVVHLLLRLRGGKGGFGSLLRGAATNPGQKKTNNFDACRDMSGRRLRHVNAEKKLEEWRAEAEERKLEKMAEAFIKKKEKESGGKKAKRNDDAEKYVAKYREDSAKCMEEVERTVRESLKGVLAGKRKGAVSEGRKGAVSKGSEAEAKKMKIWLGKRKLADSGSEDSDSDDSDSEEENEKSVVINNGNHSDSSKEAERSSDSVTGARPDISGSEEEKDVVCKESPYSGNAGDCCASSVEAETRIELGPEGSEERGMQNEGEFALKAEVVPRSESLSHEKEVANFADYHNNVQSVSQPPVISDSGVQDSSPTKVDTNPNFDMGQEETLSMSPEVPDLPLNLEECNSAVKLEVLGMERLKSELQARGLKCGGTLQERAARLFLLKTIPLEKLPKKLFAKK